MVSLLFMITVMMYVFATMIEDIAIASAKCMEMITASATVKDDGEIEDLSAKSYKRLIKSTASTTVKDGDKRRVT